MDAPKRYHSVQLDKSRCKGCTNCLMHCPTEAIRVRDGRAHIIAERCIDCGECIRICDYHAKVAVTDKFDTIKAFRYAIALPAPSLYGQFRNLQSVQPVLSALKKIGFDDVFEVARGADIVSRAIAQKLREPNLPRPLISSACPAILRLIRVRFPDLLEHLLPLQPPVELAAVLARRAAVQKTGLAPEEIGVAFITPCPAKVTAAKVPLGNLSHNIDAAIAISRIYPQLVQEIKDLTPEQFEGLSRMGSTGLGWAANSGEATGSGQRRYIAADGIENVIKILEAIEDEQFTRLDFVELSACPGGCVGGVMNVENPFAAAARIKRLARELPPTQTRWETPDLLPEEVFFNKKIEPVDVMALGDDPATSLELFARMQAYERKFPGLDCGSCGSPTCHALAEDIVRGYRTEDDCIYLLKEKLEALAQSLAGLSHHIPREDKDHDGD